MARKKQEEEHVNLERWLISYADFITLLFATFVVLYALSQLDLAKFKDLKVSLQKAFSSAPTIIEGDAGVLDKKGDSAMDAGGQMDNQNIVPPILDQPYGAKEELDFQDVVKDINSKKSKDSNGISAEVTTRGLVIKLSGNIVFDSSTSQINKNSYQNINDIGKIIKTKFPNHQVRIEGHTDSLPISSTVFPSNWELSSARASAVVRYMINSMGMPKDRFSALGYADSRPVAPNSTEEGRKANRRVEIVILRNNLLKSETLTPEFKNDVKKEINEFKNVTNSQKIMKAKVSNTSDAVKNLLKESGLKGNVIILDESNDVYKKDAAKILKELKEKEKQAEEEAKIKKQEFVKSVRKQFEQHQPVKQPQKD